MSQLSEHEQQQVDAAANKHCTCGTKNCAQKISFQAGVDFALQHLLPGRMERFAEWIRTFEALERQNGQWVIESQLSDKQIVKAFIEDLKQQQDESL